jgi:predicted nucleic acid-binding protein
MFDDFKELLSIFNARKVKYLIVGGYAVSLRDLYFDVLIALTARSHEARLITTNRTDFELINGYRKIKLEVW